MDKLTFSLVLLVLTFCVGPSHQQIFPTNITHGYDMTSLTKLSGDYRAYGFVASDGEFYSFYFNFWLPGTYTCGGINSTAQSCHFRGGVFYQTGDPTQLVFTNTSQYVSLKYTNPYFTPCGANDVGCNTYNQRFTEFMVYCDKSVNIVENVNCSQTSTYGYQCAFRHSSACLTNLNSTSSYNRTYNPIKRGGNSQLIFQDQQNSNSELSVYYNLTGLAYKTFNYSFIGLDGRAYEMFFSFGRNNTPECGDFDMASRGFFYQSCHKRGYNTYQMGNPYYFSYTVNNQSGITLNYTIDSFAAEYGCSIPGSSARRSRSIRYNIVCAYQYYFSYSCRETSTSCEYECTIYSVYGCPVSVSLISNSTTGGNSTNSGSVTTGYETTSSITSGGYTTGYNTSTTTGYNATTGGYNTTTGGYDTTTGGYNTTTTTGGYNTTTGGYSTTTTGGYNTTTGGYTTGGYNTTTTGGYNTTTSGYTTGFNTTTTTGGYNTTTGGYNTTTGGYSTTTTTGGYNTTTTGGYNTTTSGYTTGFNTTTTTEGYTTGGFNTTTTTGSYNTTTGGYSTTTTTTGTTSSSSTTTTSSSTGSSSEEEPYFDCSWRSNGFIVSSNQNINCSSVGVTICITNDGSKVSVPSGDLNILTRGRIECQSNHIQCRSGRNSCSIDYPVFEINGKQVNTIQEDPLSSSAPSVTSSATLITITILTIFVFLF